MNSSEQTFANRRVVAFVLNNFRNDSRVLKTCLSLKRAGYVVTVVALHDGSTDLLEREVVHGLSVHRVRLRTKAWGRARVTQLTKFAEFAWRIAIEYRGAAVYHCNDLGTTPIGMLCRALSAGRPALVYDAHEYESERQGMSRWTRSLVRFVEGWVTRRVDVVMTVSPSIADEYMRLYGIRRPEVIYNAPNFRDKVPSDDLRRRFGIPRDVAVFLYQGLLTAGRGIPILLDAFQRQGASSCLIFIGGGELEPAVRAAAAACGRIFHVPTVDPLDLWRLTMSADYGIVLIENTCLSYYYCLPNKLFEFMMAELPVIASNMFELRRFVEGRGVGVVTEVTVEALERSITEILAMDYGSLVEKIREVKRETTWEAQELRLLQIYSALPGVNGRAGPDTAADRRPK